MSKIKSVLNSQFNPAVCQNSPYIEDVRRVVYYDEDGNELVTWEPVDYPSIVKKHGTVSDWTLNALLKAGINPASMKIHTTAGTRLEGVNAVQDFSAAADAILAESKETATE